MAQPLFVDTPSEVTVRPLRITEPGWDDRGRLSAHDTDLAATTPVSGALPHSTLVSAAGSQPVPGEVSRAAHHMVRIALEVVDGLRPAARAGAFFPAPIVGMLTELARTGVPGRALGNARIHRVHIDVIHPASSDCASPAEAVDYELCATYARGPRLFAVAARIRTVGTTVRCTTFRLA